MTLVESGSNGLTRSRPGGRTARTRAAVLEATLATLAEAGFDGLEIPEVARRSGVHPATIYRRWGSKARLVGEAMLERGRPPSPTPDTGSLRGDLVTLLDEGGLLIRTPPVRALFALLLDGGTSWPAEVRVARDRFWTAHVTEVRRIVDRALARGEIREDLDPTALIELVMGPVVLRWLFLDEAPGGPSARSVVDRALRALNADGPRSADQARLRIDRSDDRG